MAKQALNIEHKIPVKLLPFQQQRQPVRVIFPHFMIGDAINLAPQRCRFRRFAQLALTPVRRKYRHVQFVTVEKLEK